MNPATLLSTSRCFAKAGIARDIETRLCENDITVTSNNCEHLKHNVINVRHSKYRQYRCFRTQLHSSDVYFDSYIASCSVSLTLFIFEPPSTEHICQFNMHFTIIHLKGSIVFNHRTCIIRISPSRQYWKLEMFTVDGESLEM